MLIKSIPTYKASFVSWKGNDGVVEASLLGSGKSVIWSQIWDDSIDVGFYLHSDRTGKDVLFTLVDEEKHGGEVVAWVFSGYPASNKRLTVKVLND